MKRIAMYSPKGGVGKTTTATNVAHAAAQSGARVLLWDLDPQGGASHLARVRQHIAGGAKRLVGKRGALEAHVCATGQTGLHVIPADLSLRALDLHLDDAASPTRRLDELLRPLDDRYDVCLVDCPAGMTLASDAVFAAVEALVVPTIPTVLSVRALDQLVAVLESVSPRPAVLPFISMIDRRKRIHRDGVVDLIDRYPALLRTQIPTSIAIERSAIDRVPVVVAEPRSAVAGAYADLWADIAERLWP
jgi:chromosome partitioning protein